MHSHLKHVTEKQLIQGVPGFVVDGLQYEVIGGSTSYGVSSDSSDMDIVGFCIPEKAKIWPHLAGDIPGWGREKPDRFNVWSRHHIKDPSALGGSGRNFDFSIYNIVDFFQLCLENNPNMVDSLFVPIRCVSYMTQIGEMIRSRRHDFLSTRVWHTFKGYAYSQLCAIKSKDVSKTLLAINDFEKQQDLDRPYTKDELIKEKERRDAIKRRSQGVDD